MSIDPRDKFFPTAPTLADYDAAVKRAADAEDHLKREVASSQALVVEAQKRDETIAKVRASNLNLIDMRNAVVRENDAWREWAGDAGGRPDWNGHDHELRSIVMDRMSELRAESGRLRTEALARDAVIADLLAQVDVLKATIAGHEKTLEAWASAKARDASFIADRRADLGAERTARQNGEGVNRNLLATLAARDSVIDDQNQQLATLRELLEFKRSEIADLENRLSNGRVDIGQ